LTIEYLGSVIFCQKRSDMKLFMFGAPLAKSRPGLASEKGFSHTGNPYGLRPWRPAWYKSDATGETEG
jgi:hypothetical protein